MAAEIGILGESKVTTATTTTVYTVPTNRSAKFRLLFGIEWGGATSSFGFLFNDDSFWDAARDSGVTEDIWTGYPYQNASHGVKKEAGNNGIHVAINGGTLDLSNVVSGQSPLLAPLEIDYFLSESDTIKTDIGGAAATDIYFMVIGVEDDAPTVTG